MNSEIMGKVAIVAADGVWVRSSRCIPDNNCIELRVGHSVVGVRDSKNLEGSMLEFDGDRWDEFLRTIIR